MARSSSRKRPPAPETEAEHHDTPENETTESSPIEEEQSNRRRKKQKVRVMEDSNQTDSERRDLRCKLRDMQRKIKGTEDGDNIEDPTSGAFDEFRKANNDLFDEVRYNREGVLDGENLDLLASRAKKQVSKLIQLPTYDATRLVTKLREKGTSTADIFDWRHFGRETGVCFNAPPHAVFFQGPFDSEYEEKVMKQRQPRQKRQVEEEEEELDEEEKDGTAKEDKLSAVEKHIRVISKTLKKRCDQHIEEVKSTLPQDDDATTKAQVKKAKGDGICAVQFLFNPRSFTQTIENIFHFSFLVKKGDAGIQVVEDENGRARPTVRYTQLPSNTEPSHSITPSQSIVSLNMAQWREMVESYQVDKSDIPHRTGSKIVRSEEG